MVIPDAYINAGGVTVSYFEWVKNLGHVRFGRMQKRFEQGAYSRLLEAVEGVTGRRFTPEEIERVTQGASEEDLVNSGLEETMIGAYHPIRETWKQHGGKDGPSDRGDDRGDRQGRTELRAARNLPLTTGGFMDKRFLVAWIIVFIVWMVGSFVVHGVLLAPGYQGIPSCSAPRRTPNSTSRSCCWRTPSWPAHWCGSIPRGARTPPGPARAPLRAGGRAAHRGPWYLIYYAVQPMPGAIVARQIMFDTILTLLLGLVVAYLYRGRRAPA